MPGFILLDGVRQSEVRGNTPSASGHLYTTLARSLNKPKLDYKKAVLAKFGPEFENIAGVQTLTNFFLRECGGPVVDLGAGKLGDGAGEERERVWREG